MSHPACFGYSISPFTQVILKADISTKQERKETQLSKYVSDNDVKRPKASTISAREYLEKFVFPTLLPALELCLHKAEKMRCFEVSYKNGGMNQLLIE